MDRIRLAEAFRIAERVQNTLWPGWNKAPFGLVLVSDEHEFLIRHAKPSDEFRSIGYDDLLKSEVFVRPRKFSKHFLATFPAFDRTPLIVVGTAENTVAKTSTAWVFVVLHEHFHQLQMSQPNYFKALDELALSRGDTTGMWQLNFPFPYDNKEVADKFKALSNQLIKAFLAKSGKLKKRLVAEYLHSRTEFADMLNPDDYKYISLQLWQEGIARYTQYRIADLAAKSVRPSRLFRRLKDYTPYNSESVRLLSGILNEARRIDLPSSQRAVAYPFGCLEGLLLDHVKPGWRNRYFDQKFKLHKLY